MLERVLVWWGTFVAPVRRRWVGLAPGCYERSLQVSRILCAVQKRFFSQRGKLKKHGENLRRKQSLCFDMIHGVWLVRAPNSTNYGRLAESGAASFSTGVKPRASPKRPFEIDSCWEPKRGSLGLVQLLLSRPLNETPSHPPLTERFFPPAVLFFLASKIQKSRCDDRYGLWVAEEVELREQMDS